MTTTVDWASAAACRGSQRAAFFPPNSIERREERIEREAVAKRICAGCAVLSECLELAVRNHEIHGIWGGLNEEERRSLLRSA
jgi:WhiB family transcriptional regulator, redox-sensing transcriptional regulator